MGNFYTNYTLRGPSQQAIVGALAGRSAIVTPVKDGCVVVFDEESDEQDTAVITALASRLSREFHCPVLAVLNHDDDILWYQLYLSGELADEYDSCPGYCDPEAEPSAPAGGDAQKLCSAFGASDIAAVETVLRKSSFDDDGYTFEIDRHEDLADALGIPSFGVGAGFGYVSDGELPEGLDEDTLIRVLPCRRTNACSLPFICSRVGESPNGYPARMNNRAHALAEKIWHYHQMKHQLQKADAILVLCSHDKKVAETGAQLFLEGWAPLLIFAGGLGSVTREMWTEPEADQFAGIAIALGVPSEKILIENKSTNTGENILFTKQLLAEKRINPQRFILVQKPYMERRSFATFKKVWPDKDVIVTSPQVSFDEYLSGYTNEHLSKDDVISIMVGDLQRIKVYPIKGFQIHQEIPSDVWSAYEELVNAGYDQRLVHLDS